MDVRCFSSPRDRRLSLCSASAARHPRRNSLLLPSHAKANAKAKAANPPARRTLRHHPPPTRVTNHHASLPTAATTTASLISLALYRQASRRPTHPPSHTHILSHRPASFHLPDLRDHRCQPPEESRRPSCVCGVLTTCLSGLQPRRFALTAIHLASQVLRTRGQSSLPCPLDCTLACNNPTATYGKPPCSLLSRCESRI